MKKIVNIIIFTIAGIACVLGVIFSTSFDDKQQDKYFAVNKVKEEYPQMISDLTALKVETLPDFVKKYQDLIGKRSAELKNDQLQKDIFYTYYVNLKEIDDQAKFDEFVKSFPEYSAKLFKEAKNPQYYTEGFAKVKSFNDLPAYLKTIEADYNVVKQAYLLQNDHLKSANELLKLADEINALRSKEKKEIDLTNLINSVDGFSVQTNYIDYSMYLSYVIFFLTIGSLAFFLVYHMAKSFKSSVGGLLGFGFIFIVAIIGYFLSSGELTDKAIELQVTSTQMKWIGSGLIIFYVIFFGTILMIVGSMVMNLVKKYR